MGACGESGIRETHQTAMETGVLGNVNCAWVYIHMSIGYEPNVEPEREDRLGGDAPAGAADEAHQEELKRVPPNEKDEEGAPHPSLADFSIREKRCPDDG